MSIFTASKVLAQLPSTLQPDRVYYVRTGEGFDTYITDGSAIAYKANTAGGLPTTPQLTWGTSPAQATLDASGLTAARTLTLPDVAGTILTSVNRVLEVQSGYVVGAADAGGIVDVVTDTGAGANILIPGVALNAAGGFVIVRNGTLVPLSLVTSTTPFGNLPGKPQISASGGVVYVYLSAAGDYLDAWGDLDRNAPVTKTGNYTLGWGDQFGGVLYTGTVAGTIEVPTNASFAAPVGAIIPVRQGATGVATIAAASGVTLDAKYGLSTSGAGDARVLEQTAKNIWSVY